VSRTASSMGSVIAATDDVEQLGRFSPLVDERLPKW
jgi:hypothetical protein